MSLTALAFVLFFAGGLLFALFVRPIIGLYIYIATFYLHPPSRWWGSELPEFRWSLIAAFVTLIALLMRGTSKQSAASDSWYNTSLAKGLILYTVWMWIQAPWVVSPWHLEGTILFTKYVLLFFLIVRLLESEKDFVGFCLAHVLGCAYLGWLVFVAPDGGRLEGVGGPGIDNANTLGMHLATGLFFASFLALALTGWRRLIPLASIPFILNGVIQTQTRGAIVGIFLGGIVTIFLKPRKFRRQYYAFAVLGISAMLFFANEAFTERMNTMRASVDQTVEWDSGALTRIETVKAQLRMFLDYPLGAGHQGTAALSKDYLDERWLASDSGDRASHNTVLSILVDQGVPGFMILIVLGFSVSRMLRKHNRVGGYEFSDRYALYFTMLGGTMVAIYASGMFAQYLKAEVQIWVLALVAVMWNFQTRLTRNAATAYPGGINR